MKIHLTEAEIQRAITSVYVEPLLDYSMTDRGETIGVTIELKATRGVEGMTCDIVIGDDASDKPLGIQKAVETARATSTDVNEEKLSHTDVAQSIDTQNGTQTPVQSEVKAEGTEQAPEAPKRRGRPPGSKNKATLEAEAAAASNDTATGAAPEEVAESMQEEEEANKPEPSPEVKAGGLFANLRKPADETKAAEPEAPFEQEAEQEPSEEDQLAAEAQRTEPAEEPVDNTPPAAPTRSLFGNMTRPKND